MQLSIIIVNYYSEDLIANCLQSLQDFELHLSHEIIVVSNGSDDARKNSLLQRFPSIQWLEMGYNAGFARANNAGLRRAKGELLLLLNPDTLAVDNSIDQCCRRLAESPFAACGVQLLDVHRTPQISGSFFVKGGLNHLLPIPYWGDFIRWLGYQARTKVPNVQEAIAVEEVDWISGAFLMVKRSALMQAGLMDEDFFLYGEEVEWCSRLKKTGKLVLFGNLQIIHLEGETINKSQSLEEKGYYNLYDRKGLQLMVSNHLRVRKQYGVGWYFVLLLNYSFGWFVFTVVGTLHLLFKGRNLRPLWKRVGGFGKNMVALWRLTPTILRNKPHFYKMF